MVRQWAVLGVVLSLLLLGGCGPSEKDACSGDDCASGGNGSGAGNTGANGSGGSTGCADGDGDGACDDIDVCPDVSDPGQADFNGDGLGDACDTIVIPLASLTPTATFFTYEALTTTVRYFAVLDGTNAPHVAFDACDVCYGAKKGYQQVGTEMVCNNCGNSFEITGIGTENVGGGCWPGYLEVALTATDILIEPETLEAGSWYFP
jgi:hypothetical protein